MIRFVRRLVLPSLAVSVAFCAVLVANASAARSVRFLTTIHITDSQGQLRDPGTFDISWVDQRDGRYYLADGSNNAVEVINARTDRFVGFIGQQQFHPNNPACTSLPSTEVGQFDCGAPNGVLTDDRGRVWVGDSTNGQSSSVKVLNPRAVSKSLSQNPRSVLATVPVGGKARTDEMAYDPRDEVILVANPASVDHFLTWISVRTLKILGHYSFPIQGFNGIEQPVWDPQNDLFYVNVPGAGSTGMTDVFKPSPGPPLQSLTIPGCGAGSPAGLALGPGFDLFSACANGVGVVDAHNGTFDTLVTSLPGADELWFNPGDRNVYVPLLSSSTLGVLNADNDRVVTSPLQGIPLPAGEGPPLVHSVAAYAGNNHVFMPEGCAPSFHLPCNPHVATGGYGIAVFVSGHQHHRRHRNRHRR